MNHKTRLWLGLIVVTLIAYLDFQFFSEVKTARHISPLYRQLGHLVALLLIAAVGVWGWTKHPMAWTKKLFTFSYGFAFITIVIIGAIQTAGNVFSTGILDRVSEFRLFFSSPLPYLILYMLTIIAQRTSGK